MIDKKLDEISFDFLRIPEVESYYIADKKKWNGLCSSFQLLSDTERAIQLFNLEDYNYLTLLGLFQAFFIQQDCILQFYSCLLDKKLDLKNYPSLENIRKIRNDAFGHPANRKGKSRHLINYAEEFDEKIIIIITWNDTTDDSFYTFNLKNLLEEQQQAIFNILESIDFEKIKMSLVSK